MVSERSASVLAAGALHAVFLETTFLQILAERPVTQTGGERSFQTPHSGEQLTTRSSPVSRRISLASFDKTTGANVSGQANMLRTNVAPWNIVKIMNVHRHDLND